MDLAINVINEVLKNNPEYTTHEQILNHILNRFGHDDELTELLNNGIQIRLSQIELELRDLQHTDKQAELGKDITKKVIEVIKKFEVRPYQLEYINQCSKLFQEGHDRCLMKSPTGSGKNLMVMSTAKNIINDENSVKPYLIVCLSPRIDITKQITNPEYLAILQPYQFTPVIVHSDISYLKSNKEFLNARNESKHIIISGTYQSIGRIMDMINQVSNIDIDFLIMDEAHYLAGQNPCDATTQDSRLIFSDSRVKRRLFVTATPYEHQETDSSNYGPLVNIVSVGQLIRLGYLAKLESSICRIAENKACSASDGEFTDKAKGLYDFMTLNKRRKCIVFVNSKQNGYELHALITARGYSEFKVVTYFGEDSSQVLEDFKTCTEPIVIITCKRINMGVDVPDVDSIVFADPRLSMWDISQCIGRGLRLVGNKVCHCLLYDNEEHNHMIMNYLNYVVNECEYEIVNQVSKPNKCSKKHKGSSITSHKSYNGVIDVRLDLLSEFNSQLNKNKKEDEVVDEINMNISNKYKCKKCEKSYKKISSLKEHIYKTHISHNKDRVISQSLDNQQVESCKLNKQIKLHVCKYCNTNFTTSYSLDRHLKDRCKNKSNITTNNQTEKYEIASSMLHALFDVLQYNLGLNSS
jgi:superfamily II DNA or RNA helicase